MRLENILRKNLILVAAFGIALALGSASADDKLDSLPYFPLKVGTEWKYVRTSPDGQERTLVLQVVAREKIAGVLCASVKESVEGQEGGTTVHLAVVDDMLVCYGSNGEKDESGFAYLLPGNRVKTTLNKGDSWADSNGMSYWVGYRVVSVDHEFKVLGRSVKTAAVARKSMFWSFIASGQTKGTLYYAKGIGLVREELDTRDGKYVTELRSFRAGGDERKAIEAPAPAKRS
jgi:hypothetical protein